MTERGFQKEREWERDLAAEAAERPAKKIEVKETRLLTNEEKISLAEMEKYAKRYADKIISLDDWENLLEPRDQARGLDAIIETCRLGARAVVIKEAMVREYLELPNGEEKFQQIEKLANIINENIRTGDILEDEEDAKLPAAEIIEEDELEKAA